MPESREIIWDALPTAEVKGIARLESLAHAFDKGVGRPPCGIKDPATRRGPSRRQTATAAESGWKPGPRDENVWKGTHRLESLCHAFDKGVGRPPGGIFDSATRRGPSERQRQQQRSRAGCPAYGTLFGAPDLRQGKRHCQAGKPGPRGNTWDAQAK